MVQNLQNQSRDHIHFMLLIDSFATHPAHRCNLIVCSPQHICAFKGTPQCKVGDTDDAELIPCRRCPVAYHMECIPKQIMSSKHKARGKRVWIAKGRCADGGLLPPPSTHIIPKITKAIYSLTHSPNSAHCLPRSCAWMTPAVCSCTLHNLCNACCSQGSGQNHNPSWRCRSSPPGVYCNNLGQKYLRCAGQYLGDPVDRSLLYCMKHRIPSKRENPRLDKPLFTEELLSSWRKHYAKTYV